MVQRRGVGIATGEYQGRGQGEAVECDPRDEPPDEPLDDDVVEEERTVEMAAPNTDSSKPLLDIETTGFSIYQDDITDIAAKVADINFDVSQASIHSLVMTSRNILEKGRYMYIHSLEAFCISGEADWDQEY